MDTVLSHILDFLGNTAAGLLIVGFVVWQIAAFYFTRFKKTEKKVESLPCDKHREHLREVSAWIVKKDKSMANTLMAKLSPYQLTDAGKKLLEISGGKLCVDQNLDMFMSELGKQNPLTPYDVEEKSVSIILETKQQPIFNQIKNFLYYMPKTIEGVGDAADISIFTVVNVMSLYLRDFYLEAHPELIPEMTAK